MTLYLCGCGYAVNRKRVQRLMRKMGLEALILKRRGLSRPHPDHPVYPYLLKGVEVTRPNQVWSADITYVPVRGGSAYLVAILDWYSRKVLAWELSNTLDASFCARALRRALAGDRRSRGLLLVPWVIPLAMSTLTWWWMFDPLSGVINPGDHSYVKSLPTISGTLTGSVVSGVTVTLSGASKR